MADLMNNYEDLMRIKFGMKTLFNVQLTNNPDAKANFEKESGRLIAPTTTTENALFEMKKRLKLQKEKLNLTQEEYIYEAYKLSQKVMKYKWENIGIVAGSKFVKEMVQFFSDYSYTPQVTYFYDKGRQAYIKVYSLIVGDEMRYFSSKGINNTYEFIEVDQQTVDYYQKNYSTAGYYHLILMQNEILQYKNIYDIINQKKR